MSDNIKFTKPIYNLDDYPIITRSEMLEIIQGLFPDAVISVQEDGQTDQTTAETTD